MSGLRAITDRGDLRSEWHESLNLYYEEVSRVGGIGIFQIQDYRGQATGTYLVAEVCPSRHQYQAPCDDVTIVGRFGAEGVRRVARHYSSRAGARKCRSRWLNS